MSAILKGYPVNQSLYCVSNRLESLNEEITWTCSVIPQNTPKAKFWNTQFATGRLTQAVNLHLYMWMSNGMVNANMYLHINI